MANVLNESLNKAFSLLEEDDLSIIEVESTEPEEEIVVEEPNEEVVDTLTQEMENLESRVENLEAMLNIDEPEMNEFDVNTGVKYTPEEEFDNKIRKDFIFYSKYPEDIEITEELLDKRACKNSYIPSVAVKNKISRKEVVDSLLGR